MVEAEAAAVAEKKEEKGWEEGKRKEVRGLGLERRERERDWVAI